jgi:hypothetical protein
MWNFSTHISETFFITQMLERWDHVILEVIPFQEELLLAHLKLCFYFSLLCFSCTFIRSRRRSLKLFCCCCWLRLKENCKNVRAIENVRRSNINIVSDNNNCIKNNMGQKTTRPSYVESPRFAYESNKWMKLTFEILHLGFALFLLLCSERVLRNLYFLASHSR